ncbi:MAG: phage holin family protein [Acidobacteria bacterium]|nr:MAG: phage holin family protein [Acidobacteriota bacterium]REK04335.1 MAG: phage holin family protein [Acidobacteriota bacterium]
MREVVGASLQLLQAEIDELRAQLGAETARLVRLALIVGVAAGFAFWGLAVLIAAAVLALALVLEPWLAALIVGLVLSAVAGGFAIWARARVRRMRSPAALVEERLRDHLAWWEREIRPATPAHQPRTAPGPAPAPGIEGPAPDEFTGEVR